MIPNLHIPQAQANPIMVLFIGDRDISLGVPCNGGGQLVGGESRGCNIDFLHVVLIIDGVVIGFGLTLEGEVLVLGGQLVGHCLYFCFGRLAHTLAVYIITKNLLLPICDILYFNPNIAYLVLI